MAKAKKDMKQYMVWLVTATLLLTGINVLLNVFAMAQPMLDGIVLLLGFASLLGLIYAYNEFKFKSLLDLTLLVVLIAGLAFLAMSGVVQTPSTNMLLTSIWNGFMSLITGLIVGGVIAIPIGLLRLKNFKK